MLKVKVNLDKKSYDTLINDIILFKIIKNDGTPNKNKFMNILFSNYLDEYNKKEQSLLMLAANLKSKYNINDQEFINDIIIGFGDKYESTKLYYNTPLTFTLTEENSFIFENLDEVNIIGASSFFRRLIYNYLENPQYLREQIIYKDIVEKIEKAIKNNHLIKIRLETTDIITIPYKLSTSKEEIYTYLLNYKNKTPSSIHLMKIKNVIELKDTFILKSDEITLLNEVLRLGVQFPFKKKCEAEIELTPDGIKQFNNKYLHRPAVEKIDGNIYHFCCSFDQLLLYFSSFGSTIKIHKPKDLRKAIYHKYKGYVMYYENNDNN